MSHMLGSNFSGPVYLAADHAGYEMKEFIEDKLAEHGLKIFDLGAHDYDAHDDYTEIVLPVREKVARDIHARAIVFCGSGQGEGMVLNRAKGIRAAVFYGPRSAIEPLEIEKTSPSVDGFDAVRLARLHNDANVLCLGARFMTVDESYHAAMLFLGTPFSGTERHVRRIKAIDAT